LVFAIYIQFQNRKEKKGVCVRKRRGGKIIVMSIPIQ